MSVTLFRMYLPLLPLAENLPHMNTIAAKYQWLVQLHTMTLCWAVDTDILKLLLRKLYSLQLHSMETTHTPYNQLH